MKNLLLAMPILILALATSLQAQLPEKAEDISPLLIGETMPNTSLKGLDGAVTPFLDIVKEKPTVLVVYRGGWCPYCNKHLSALGQNEGELLELGYQLVAVSPDKIENLQATADKDHLRYRLFSDGAGEFSKAAGIAFLAPERYENRLLEASGGENTARHLPVPAVFVLNTDGEILFEYINPDYKKRLSGDLLMAVLKALKVAD